MMGCADWVYQYDSVTTANPKYPVTMVERIESKKPTNYDRIISKTPEELTDFLYATWKQQDAFSKDVCEKCPDTSCQPKCWLDWLRREAEEGE